MKIKKNLILKLEENKHAGVSLSTLKVFVLNVEQYFIALLESNQEKQQKQLVYQLLFYFFGRLNFF